MALVEGAQIGTLTVRRVKHNTPALQLALGTLLRQANWQPAGMPPAAILIVRQLADPLPRSLPRAPLNWEHAMQDVLTACYHRAARPVRGLLPVAADEVVFADEAELLACLALDISTGRANQRWWWSLLLRHLPMPPAARLQTLLIAEARSLPAVFTHLHTWGQAVPVVQQLDEIAIQTISRALQQIYQLPFTLPAANLTDSFLTAASDSRRYSGNSSSNVSGQAVSRSDAATPLVETISPFDRHYDQTKQLPPFSGLGSAFMSDKSLSPAQKFLLGVALSLYHNRVQVRSTAFQRQLLTWWVQINRPNHVDPVQTPVVQSTFDPRHNDDPTVWRTSAAMPPDIGQATTPTVNGHDQPRSINKHDINETAAVISPISSATSEPTNSLRVEPELRQIVADEESVHLVKSAELTPEATIDSPAVMMPSVIVQGIELEGGIVSDLCGVFYLVNIMQRLHWERWPTAETLGAWGVLDALARGLLAEDQWLSDDIWPVLANLAEQEYRSHGQLLDAVQPEWRPWLAGTVDEVLTFLRQILSLDDPLVTLLHYRGRVFITRAHVDVVLHLDDISLPLRVSGLDVNPGWQPDFGRIIQFHFL